MLVVRLYKHFCAFIKHQIALQVFDVYRFICQIEIKDLSYYCYYSFNLLSHMLKKRS